MNSSWRGRFARLGGLQERAYSAEASLIMVAMEVVEVGVGVGVSVGREGSRGMMMINRRRELSGERT